MDELYNDSCDTCRTQRVNLAKKKEFKKVLKSLEKAFKRLHKNEGYNPEDLQSTPEYQEAIKETYDLFDTVLQDNVVEGELLKALQNDVFLFSSLRTHAQLLEASRLLLDENKKIKPFSKFEEDYKKINTTYNSNYLESEYLFATGSAQQADHWSRLDPDYLLQYRTAGDNAVRDSHKVLHNITLPIDDPFWIYYATPNGWRCRCTERQVRKGKYDISDSKEAIKKGEAATTQIDKDGKNKLKIFRFNPGINKVVFPPEHPYHKIQGANIVKEGITNE